MTHIDHHHHHHCCCCVPNVHCCYHVNRFQGPADALCTC
jgi:hypothetical protein